MYTNIALRNRWLKVNNMLFSLPGTRSRYSTHYYNSSDYCPRSETPIINKHILSGQQFANLARTCYEKIRLSGRNTITLEYYNYALLTVYTLIAVYLLFFF